MTCSAPVAKGMAHGIPSPHSRTGARDPDPSSTPDTFGMEGSSGYDSTLRLHVTIAGVAVRNHHPTTHSPSYVTRLHHTTAAPSTEAAGVEFEWIEPGMGHDAIVELRVAAECRNLGLEIGHMDKTSSSTLATCSTPAAFDSMRADCCHQAYAFGIESMQSSDAFGSISRSPNSFCSSSSDCNNTGASASWPSKKQTTVVRPTLGHRIQLPRMASRRCRDVHAKEQLDTSRQHAVRAARPRPGVLNGHCVGALIGRPVIGCSVREPLSALPGRRAVSELHGLRGCSTRIVIN
eukprot:CAMPEP_0181189224 /NCGR_PEP_ID=MMETSP1096-20121128/11548_1 /TAXON_ID=156174 ORGANISM="Chrysochromulina ericina, Strain CCMP281" /NCGR_SAMPLE_ID=MMETSP1096 /ASSEMBLY_ACC=CAM_ASM_000453 /LENGTH=291 /DNA_ID=CAMNT_0023278363 /DNA_START=427 /DNA_END=1305 /DNA_ORIENTATION=+